jgi:hypothetical protein
METMTDPWCTQSMWVQAHWKMNWIPERIVMHTRFKHGRQFEYQIDNWGEYKRKQYSLLSVSIVPVWPSKGNDAVFHVRVSIYYPRVWPPCPPKKMRGWPCDSAVDKGESWSVFRVTPFLSRKRAIVIDRVKRTSLGPQHSYHKIQ